MAQQTSSTPPAVAMSSSLDAAQAEIAREMEAGVAAVLERAVGRLEQLAERLTRIDAQLTHVNGEADKLSACRRQSSSLRVQLQSATRDLLLAETLYTDSGTPRGRPPPAS
jgi:Zn-dependent oligopeptidase